VRELAPAIEREVLHTAVTQADQKINGLRFFPFSTVLDPTL